jgi:hypothetical protein
MKRHATAVLICCLALATPVLADYYATKLDYMAGVLTQGERPAVPKAGSDTCTAPPVIASLPFTDSGDTTGGLNTVDVIPVACNGFSNTARGPDNIYEFTVTAGNNLLITVSTPDISYDTSIYVLSTCGDGQTCVVGADNCIATELGQFPACPRFDSTEQIQASLAAGTYYLYIDSWYFGTNPLGRGAGPYDVDIEGSLPVELHEFTVD